MDEQIARNMQITYRKRIGLSKIKFKQGQLLCFRCHEYKSKILKDKTIDHKDKSSFKQTPALFPRLLRREFTPLPRPATVDSDVSSSSEKLTPLKAVKENRHVQQSANRKSAKNIPNEIFQVVGIPPLADIQDCVECSSTKPSEIVSNFFDGDEDDQATWTVWKRVDKKVDLQRITGNIQSLFDVLDNQ
ncbi:unnamed protein product [Didymodactylos carnosus]|uniref:Uncharacterized protein n=1 Tax=Didymodactylos carnosus TaxID=1234261 RepID=A0A815V1L0_9BILA|nr:unnamed protein product [Didymodactylos carnosus]CAF1524897.1 unnamed protein product [Didymodactylos carnosus]CAF3765945.1 unnamed protein product [Didymodactylos carnosus]CAF4383804.1 unnamed protein product [Didymodactylos carnosus]